MTDLDQPSRIQQSDVDVRNLSGEAKIYQLLRRLCQTSCPTLPPNPSQAELQHHKEVSEFIFNHSLQQLRLGSRLPSSMDDEESVVRRVHKNLLRQRRDSSTALFSERVAKLEKVMPDQGKRCAMLAFLLRMMSDSTYQNSTLISDMSSVMSLNKFIPSDLNLTNATSGISLGFDASHYTTQQQFNTQTESFRAPESELPLRSRSRSSNTTPHSAAPSRYNDKAVDAVSCYGVAYTHMCDGVVWGVCEQDLVRDLIFIFQGAAGTHIQWDSNRHCFYFPNETRIPIPVYGMCMKMTELGKLYRKVNSFVAESSNQQNRKQNEILVQAFKTAVKDHLFEYYRFISVLDGKLHREVSNPEEGPLLSLRRLMVWTYEPLHCFQMLSTVLDQCNHLTGCQLMNKIYEFSRTGHPDHGVLLKTILGKLFSPFKSILDKWLYEGELPSKQTYSQFFIRESQKPVKEEIWNTKYIIMKEQVPSFISSDLAMKVVVTGKTVNFLKERCLEHKLDVDLKYAEVLKEAESETFDSLIEGHVETRIRQAYAETCRHLLKVLKEKFYFYDHLKAMRRYLLLGQGDFIRMLMDLLYDDLEKDGKHILRHNLIALMYDAVRATNARFEEDYILDRLDIMLMEAIEGEKGWDIFSLYYHFKKDGPLSCIFEEKVMKMYLKIFNFIWRAHRTEYLLSKAWKNLQVMDQQWAKALRISELYHMSHILVSAMIHYTRQMHYYLSFEVLSCSWDELLTRLEKATDLDQIREAHTSCLYTILTSCFVERPSMSEEEKELSTRHRGISDNVVRFISKLNVLYSHCKEEQERRMKLAAKRGVDWKRELEGDAELRDKFNTLVEEYIAPDLRLISNSLMRILNEFVKKLKDHRDSNVRLLGTRLDFNNFFLKFNPDV